VFFVGVSLPQCGQEYPSFVRGGKGEVVSWLYDHRDQLDGLRPFVEIAYHVTYGIDPCDRDDVEQDIIIALLLVSQRRKEPAYLWGVAKKEVKRYWHRKLSREGKFRPFYHDEDFASDDGDNDARLDALAVLATLPQRLVAIGYDRLNGKKLNTADQQYWIRYKAKLDCRRNGRGISDDERRRIVRLHNKGASIYTIMKATGRHRKTINQCFNRI